MAQELYSGYLYLAMQSYFEAQNLKGFAQWFRVQAQEELGHGLKFFDYITDAGGRAVMEAIAAPKKDFASPKAVFTEGLEHEKGVSAAIHRLMEQAKVEQDYATEVFLQWFVTEQVEEEASFTLALSMVERAGTGLGLVEMDEQFGERGKKA
jgi:ferritin